MDGGQDLLRRLRLSVREHLISSVTKYRTDW